MNLKRSGILFPVFSTLTDLAAVLLALLLSLRIQAGFVPGYPGFPEQNTVRIPAPAPFALVLSLVIVFRLLEFDVQGPVLRRRSLLLNLKGAVFSALALITVSYLFSLDLTRSLLPLYLVCSTFLLSMASALGFEVYRRVESRLDGRMAMIGINRDARAVGDTVAEMNCGRDRFCGYIVNGSNGKNGSGEVIGTLSNLESIIWKYKIRRLIICRSVVSHHELLHVADVCRRNDIEYYFIPDLLDAFPVRTRMCHIGNIPMLRVRRADTGRLERIMKRCFDVTAVLLGGIALLPVMLLTALLIRLDSPGPVIYSQKRIGKNGKEFSFYKFRSMVTDADRLRELVGVSNHADKRLYKVKSDPRITRVGKVIRKLSLDELPQIWNVLRGDMSLVGPRPLPVPDVENAVSDPENAWWYSQRIKVFPGITGMWQTHGRSDVSFEEMARFDMYYVLNWSFSLDMRILVHTIPAVFTGRGAY